MIEIRRFESSRIAVSTGKYSVTFRRSLLSPLSVPNHSKKTGILGLRRNWQWRQEAPPKRLYLFTNWHDVISHEVLVFINSVMRTSKSPTELWLLKYYCPTPYSCDSGWVVGLEDDCSCVLILNMECCCVCYRNIPHQ